MDQEWRHRRRGTEASSIYCNSALYLLLALESRVELRSHTMECVWKDGGTGWKDLIGQEVAAVWLNVGDGLSHASTPSFASCFLLLTFIILLMTVLRILFKILRNRSHHNNTSSVSCFQNTIFTAIPWRHHYLVAFFYQTCFDWCGCPQRETGWPLQQFITDDSLSRAVNRSLSCIKETLPCLKMGVRSVSICLIFWVVV
jgi:hypothetical protein